MRIASLQPSISVTLAHLGRLDALCACTKYCLDVVPELRAANVVRLQDSWSFDKPGELERLLATKPDLVIASVPYRLESLAAILKAGLPLLALAPRSLHDVFDDITLIGRQLEALPAAKALVEGMQAEIDQTSERTACLPTPTVYCEEWGKPLIHSQGWVAELVQAAGGEFIGVPGAHTTAKDVAALDPDILVFAWCGAGDRVPLERLIAQRKWQEIRAVKTRSVYCVPDECLNTPAFTLVDGLRCLAGAIHPEVFPPHAGVRQLKG